LKRMNLCCQGFCLHTLNSRHVQSWKVTDRRVSKAKIIVDGSILIETELLVISLLDSNVANRKVAHATRFSGDLGELGRHCLGAVESASAHEVGNYRHQIEPAYPSKVSPCGRGLAELENSACRDVRPPNYDRDWVAGMRPIAYRGSVVGCQRDIIEPYVDFIDNVAYEAIHLFQRSDFAFEIAIMACDVGRFYVDENEVLVFASFDDCLGLCFVVRLDPATCALDVHDLHSGGHCYSLDHWCSADATSSEVEHGLEAWKIGNSSSPSCQNNVRGPFTIVGPFLIQWMFSQCFM